MGFFHLAHYQKSNNSTTGIFKDLAIAEAWEIEVLTRPNSIFTI